MSKMSFLDNRNPNYIVHIQPTNNPEINEYECWSSGHNFPANDLSETEARRKMNKECPKHNTHTFNPFK